MSLAAQLVISKNSKTNLNDWLSVTLCVSASKLLLFLATLWRFLGDPRVHAVNRAELKTDARKAKTC